MFKKTVLALAVLSLSGCSWAPGMQMGAPSSEAKNEAAKFNITPSFVAITPKLLAEMPRLKSYKYYHIAPQDVLSLSVWDHPEFSSSGSVSTLSSTNSAPFSSETKANVGLNPANAPAGFLVDADGNIYFPLIGYVNVQGNTTDQIRSQLVDLLSKYIRKPIIDVRVAGYRSQRVYLMGEVSKAGMLNLTDTPLTLTDAISMAGGINQDTANPEQIYVIRGDMEKPTVYWLDASSASALIMGENFRLENNDIVFVSTADVARWNRAISQIMPTIQTVFYTQASIHQSN